MIRFLPIPLAIYAALVTFIVTTAIIASPAVVAQRDHVVLSTASANKRDFYSGGLTLATIKRSTPR